MIIRVVRMHFRPEAEAAFRELFSATRDAIRAQPGCLHLELWQDAHEPLVYCTYSHWESEDALNAYRGSELFGRVWPATKRLFAAPPQAFSVHPAETVPAPPANGAGAPPHPLDPA